MTPEGNVAVLVNTGPWEDAPQDILERAARSVLRAEGRHDGELSITLLSDADIAELNGRYLGREGPTDVIAFSLGSEDRPLGDVYVGVEQARRQAQELKIPVVEELARLVIHGTLHVLGHDHPEGAERVDSPMFEVQESFVRALFPKSEAS